MRIVLDTNILIAAFIARGVCHDVFEYCARRHTPVTSDFVLDEFTRKFVGKFKCTSELTDQAATLLRSRMEVLTPTVLDTPVCRDEDDDNILAIAVMGNRDLIITGDKDLLVLKQFGTVQIISPGDFQTYKPTA